MAFGRQTVVVLHGTLRLKGVEHAIDVRTSLEPVIGADGAPRLVLEADWSIRLLEPFGINGPPDGPVPARDTVLLHCRLIMASAVP